ncbi:MAG: hypothetical protein U0575_10030 [Phycisphaerales bacterium]
MSVSPEHRRRLIRELLRADRVHSQDELRRRLRQQGVRAEQATLSRDLHALGVVKGPDGYLLPEAPVAAAPARAELRQLARQYVVSADATGPLAVIRTGPGRAQPVGLALDNARIDGVLGTIAGDDTIFVATRDAALAARLAALLRKIASGADVGDDAFEFPERRSAPSTSRIPARRNQPPARDAPASDDDLAGPRAVLAPRTSHAPRRPFVGHA